MSPRSLLDGKSYWPWWLLVGLSAGVTFSSVIGIVPTAVLVTVAVCSYGISQLWGRRRL